MSNAIEFPDNHELYSKNLNSLLIKCVETHSALFLSCILHKLLKQSNQTSSLIYIMDFILKFLPHQYRDFDIIYLYYLACEIIELNQWDLSNPSVQEKTMKLEQTLTYFGSIHTNDGWTKKITQFSIGNDFNNIKMSHATSLACRSVHVFIGQILSFRKGKFTDNDDRLLINKTKDVKLEELMKLSKVKPFSDFQLFFDGMNMLSPQFIDHSLFYDIIQKLYPQIPYFSKV